MSIKPEKIFTKETDAQVLDAHRGTHFGVKPDLLNFRRLRSMFLPNDIEHMSLMRDKDHTQETYEVLLGGFVATIRINTYGPASNAMRRLKHPVSKIGFLKSSELMKTGLNENSQADPALLNRWLDFVSRTYATAGDLAVLQTDSDQDYWEILFSDRASTLVELFVAKK